MIGAEGLKSDDLDQCFEKLMMVFGGGGIGGGKMTGGRTITEWKDIPMELLLRIISLVDDDRTVIVASGVCSGWRDTICWGLTHLSLYCLQKSLKEKQIERHISDKIAPTPWGDLKIYHYNHNSDNVDLTDPKSTEFNPWQYGNLSAE